MFEKETLIKEVPFFKEKEEKEQFLLIVGLLFMRLISLKKAAELLNMESEALIDILDSANIEYSFLEDNDVKIETQW